MRSVWDDRELENDEKKKKVGELNKSLFILKIWNFKRQNDHNLSTKKRNWFY